MRKNVTITMESSLLSKTKKYLVDKQGLYLSYFIEDLIKKYFDELENPKSDKFFEVDNDRK